MFCGVIYHCAEIWSKENLIYLIMNRLSTTINIISSNFNYFGLIFKELLKSLFSHTVYYKFSWRFQSQIL